jgi:hypothetical protein
MAGKQNYTLGRGKVFFSRFKTGTQIPMGYRYIGNTPEFSLTISSENLDHFSSDEGIKEKDDSVPLSVSRTGKMTTDNINVDNVAMFFFGESTPITQAAVASADYVAENVLVGMSYRLGVTAQNPVGLRGFDLDGLTVKKGTTALVAGTDYEFNAETGFLTILEGGDVEDGDDVTVNGKILSSTQTRVISGSSPVEGALMYVANNPKGENIDYILPYVKITPDGDYALKGDEWQKIPFNIEALKPADGGEAIYAAGRPFPAV